MTAETLITEAARSGLQGLTLFKTQGGEWQASITQDRDSWTIALDADPLVAIEKVFAQKHAPVVSEMPTNNGSIFD